MVKELTNSNWCENVDGAKELSVVFFYANWCRNCKAETELCYNERVFSFPTVHFYLPGIGRVGRCVLTAKEAEPRLRGGLARFLGGSEGAPRQLLLLQELRTEVLRPIVRYKDLVGALSGLADAQSLSAAPPNKAMAGLRDAVEQDEERVAQLESLFALLDRDSDGRLSAAELEASVAALSPPTTMEAGEAGADASGGGGERNLPTPLADLLERLRGKEQLEAAQVDLATFVRIMITKAVADYTAPDKELLPAFEALDRDGSGTISREEMLSTIESFCLALPDADGCDVDPRAVLPPAFDAFANDEQLLDYERFVELVSSSGQPMECEISDEETVAGYSAIFD